MLKWLDSESFRNKSLINHMRTCSSAYEWQESAAQFFDINRVNPKDNEQVPLGNFPLCVDAQVTFFCTKIFKVG